MQVRIIFFTFIFLLFLSSQNISAAEWVYLTDMQGRKHYIDKDSIKEESGFRWSYYKSEYPIEQTGSDLISKKTYVFNSAVSYMAINCIKRSLTPLSTNYVDSNDTIVHKIRYSNEKSIIDGDKTWELDSNPETFRPHVINYICNYKITN